MEDEKILEKLQDIMIKSFNQGDITMETNIRDDLDLDSLDFVDLILEIEETWGISIPDDVAQSFTTVKDVIEYIKKENI